MTASLPTGAADRKAAPMAEGLLWYFPNALAAVAGVSKRGNDQHNPGQPMHHARGKSMDHADCIIRHLVDSGTVDTDGVRHSAKVAWRALALLQEELEREEGAPLARNAVVIPPPPEYDPDDVAFRKETVSELAAEAQSWGMYDCPPDLRYIGIGDVPKAGRIAPVVGGAKTWCDAKMEFDVRWDRRRDKTAPGTPADSAYLASFGPNVERDQLLSANADITDNVAFRRHAMRHKTDGAVADVQCFATNAAIPQHPMAAEALRDHDERLAGPESRL